MARVISRAERLKRYNDEYPVRDLNLMERLDDYARSRGWDLESIAKEAMTRMETIEANRKWETIRITMFEYPQQTDRPRAFQNHIYSPNAGATRKYFQDAIKGIRNELRLIHTPAAITIDGYIRTPDAVDPVETILYEMECLDPITKPDADNLGKTYMDMLLDSVILDDDIFHTLLVRKHYSIMPRVEVCIYYLAAHESSYIIKKVASRKSFKNAVKNGLIQIN